MGILEFVELTTFKRVIHGKEGTWLCSREMVMALCSASWTADVYAP